MTHAATLRTLLVIAAIELGGHVHVGTLLAGPFPAEAMHAPVQGFGAGTTGGAGKPDCVVGSLADSGPSTLRECVVAGNRHVKFSVAGTIRLTSLLRVGPNVTLDGFSAPSPGITLSGHGIAIFHSQRGGVDAHNVIVRGIRLRNARGVFDVTDCIGIYGPTHHIVIDHVSTEGCGDGSIDITAGPKDITIQWSILSTLPGGGKWMLIGSAAGSARVDTDRISIHHNMLICNTNSSAGGCDRAPLFNASGYVVRADLRHNIFQGWIRANATKIRSATWVNVVGNAYIPSADATFSQRNRSLAVDPGTRVFAAENIELGPLPRPNLNDHGNEALPMPAPSITERDLGCVVRDAGMHPRDAVDQQFVTYVSRAPGASATTSATTAGTCRDP